MAETLLIFLTTISFLCYIQFWEKNTFTMAMIFGGIVGLSALCKPVLLPWLPLVLIFWWQKSRLTPVQKASRVLTVVGALCLIILPWTARNHIVSGEFVPISTNLGINLLVGAHPEGRARLRQPHRLSGTLSHTCRHISWHSGRPPRRGHCVGVDNRTTTALSEFEH